LLQRLLIPEVPHALGYRSRSLSLFAQRRGNIDRHFTPFPPQLQIGSNSLPEASLLVEPIEFEAAEIISRHNPDDFTGIDNRHVTVAAVFH
jgi:hypothetical protein